MALYNPPTLTGAFMTFRISLLTSTIRATIMSVRKILRAMEIEKAGMPNSFKAVTAQVIPSGRVNWYMNVTPIAGTLETLSESAVISFRMNSNRQRRGTSGMEEPQSSGWWNR